MRRREITQAECLDLLAQAKVGRVVVVRDALPEIIPVSYRVAGETVVFGVHSESVFAEELEGTVVAFQVDSFDANRECGWHVRAIGVFRPALTPDELAVAGAAVPEPWTLGEPLDRVLQIELQFLNGYVIDAVEITP